MVTGVVSDSVFVKGKCHILLTRISVQEVHQSLGVVDIGG